MHEWATLLRTSKSQLATYLQCPRKFRFQYVEGRPWEFRPAALAFGSAVHKAAACMHEHIQKRAEKPPLDLLLECFRDSWGKETESQEILYPKNQGRASMEAMGLAMLRVFHRESSPMAIHAVELPFEVDLIDPETGEVLGLKLVGYLDLVERDAGGSFLVTEVKTAAKRYSDGAAGNWLDANCYAYALRRLGLVPASATALVRYNVLTKTKDPAFQDLPRPVSLDDERRFLRQVQEILRAVEGGAYYPNYGWWCHGCQFRTLCNRL